MKFQYYGVRILLLLCEALLVIRSIEANNYMIAFAGFAIGILTVISCFDKP